ncbi:MAG: FixH family protein [Phycisphaerae bacterium]
MTPDACEIADERTDADHGSSATRTARVAAHVAGLPVALACAAAAGCAPTSPADAYRRAMDAPPRAAHAPTPDPAVRLPYRTRSNDGTYVVAYRPVPDPIPMNDMFELEVLVAPRGTERVTPPDVDLAVDASMPAHRHGMTTRARVTRTGPGRYHVDGLLFHMPGHWELYFDITRDGETERAQVNVDLE